MVNFITSRLFSDSNRRAGSCQSDSACIPSLFKALGLMAMADMAVLCARDTTAVLLLSESRTLYVLRISVNRKIAPGAFALRMPRFYIGKEVHAKRDTFMAKGL